MGALLGNLGPIRPSGEIQALWLEIHASHGRLLLLAMRVLSEDLCWKKSLPHKDVRDKYHAESYWESNHTGTVALVLRLISRDFGGSL